MTTQNTQNTQNTVPNLVPSRPRLIVAPMPTVTLTESGTLDVSVPEATVASGVRQSVRYGALSTAAHVAFMRGLEYLAEAPNNTVDTVEHAKSVRAEALGLLEAWQKSPKGKPQKLLGLSEENPCDVMLDRNVLSALANTRAEAAIKAAETKGIDVPSLAEARASAESSMLKSAAEAQSAVRNFYLAATVKVFEQVASLWRTEATRLRSEADAIVQAARSERRKMTEAERAERDNLRAEADAAEAEAASVSASV